MEKSAAKDACLPENNDSTSDC
ncbi:unnamed protein product, partial [Rotaria magnacalcarata]